MSKGFVDVAILGASGYTGAELIRLLMHHPHVRIRALTADRKAGQPISQVFPHLSIYDLPTLIKIDELDFDSVDVVFCALPHATTQEVVLTLPEDKVVIDLSADFRLKDTKLYESVYGVAHKAIELQKTAVYGLSEVYRKQIESANLIACPGCYPTSAQLPLIPLLENNLIDPNSIIIDSKSGVTGAGKSLKEGLLFSEVSDGFNAYGIANHRHAPEIEQGLTEVNGGVDVHISFTPHLLPMNRGILSTIYVNINEGVSAEKVHEELSTYYHQAKFVHILPLGEYPATRHVRGSNYCKIGLVKDRVNGRIILVSVIDNLIKGASGQAVQNLNIRMGWNEETGLQGGAVFP